jgi:hypothetical protein
MFQRWTDPPAYWMGRLRKGHTKPVIRKIESLGLSKQLIPAIRQLLMSDELDIFDRFRVIEGYADRSSNAEKMEEVRYLLETLMFEAIDDSHVKDTLVTYPVIYYIRNFGIPTSTIDNVDKLCRMLLIMDGDLSVLKWEGDSPASVTAAIQSALLSIGAVAAPVLQRHILRYKDHFPTDDLPLDSIQTLRVLNNDLAMPFVSSLLEDLKRAVTAADRALSCGVEVTTYSSDNRPGPIVSGDDYLDSLKQTARALAKIGNRSEATAIRIMMQRYSNSVSVTEAGTFRDRTHVEVNPIHAELRMLLGAVLKRPR